jgi:Carbohydrate-binding family 9
MPSYVSMELNVSYLKNISKETPIEEISGALNKMEQHPVQKIPWPQFSYKPNVAFSIAYTEDCILLKYFVKENSIQVLHHTDNSPVHEDSCVEFFIGFRKDEEYYNLEFNCEGVCLVGYGKNSLQRQLIEREVIRKIRRLVVIQDLTDKKTNTVNWELTLAIPFEIFVHHQISSLKDSYGRGNFYKCGDKLSGPHFLAWSNITAAGPDFHLPQFFGDIHFV